MNISLKGSILIFLVGFAFAAAVAFLANFFLAGPSLGLHYDFLVKSKTPVPASREILVIETPEFIDGNDILTVLITLTEMDAANLIVTGRVSPSSMPVTVSEAEIRRRFVDEYILLSANIRNLFEAIRSGSVSPVQAPAYVERLVELTEQGRDRLLTTLIDRDEDLLRSIAAFGNYLEVYTKPVLDKDGRLRRVQPVDTESSLEHPVFLSLKSRYAVSEIESNDTDKVLWLKRLDDKEFDIHLDKNGNIITSWNSDFRRVDLELFREYENAGRRMRDALEQADDLGAFSQTLPEFSPLFLDDYASIFKEEMLKTPKDEMRTAWRTSRVNYLNSLDEFLNGQAESILVRGYDAVIADEVNLKEEGKAALARMRDELRHVFALMREEYKSLKEIYSKLEDELESSLCIMGYAQNVESSALLANALITGSHIKPAHNLYVLFWSIVASFVVLMIIFLLKPFIQLACGVGLSIIAAVCFSLYFIFFSYWIDPLVAFYSCLTGTLVIFSGKCMVIKHRSRRLRTAYSSSVSQKVLRNIIRQGSPRLTDVKVTFASVIAIRDINLLKREGRENVQDASKIKKAFFASVKKIAHDAGAVIAGFEGDTILVCFGSPLDKTANPALESLSFVRGLPNSVKSSWRFGIDLGECSFTWSQETGFSVNGRPAVRARILATRNVRLGTKALITDAMREQIKMEAKKIDSLNDSEPIFELK